MKDYHNLHLKCDILLLPDVFQKFRNNNSKNYGLCPSRYWSTLVLRWDAVVNMIKFEFELISNPDMFILFQEGVRGGVSYILNRYNKASNKYLKSSHPKQEFKHIINANNFMVLRCLSFFQQADSNA